MKRKLDGVLLTGKRHGVLGHDSRRDRDLDTLSLRRSEDERSRNGISFLIERQLDRPLPLVTTLVSRFERPFPKSGNVKLRQPFATNGLEDHKAQKCDQHAMPFEHDSPSMLRRLDEVFGTRFRMRSGTLHRLINWRRASFHSSRRLLTGIGDWTACLGCGNRK